MKIVKIIGGLGNQMFQFALYTALKERFPEERVLVDLHCFRGYGKHRGFELPGVFGVNYEEAALKDVVTVSYPYPNYLAWRIGSRLLPTRKTTLLEKPDFTLEPAALDREGSTYYDGYWQHEEYFKDIRSQLLKLYRFPPLTDNRNLETARQLTESISCSIHVRRGDYLTDPLRKGTTGIDYTERAINLMREQVQPALWCVFSDDMAWTRESLSRLLPEGQTIYVDWNNGAQSVNDMYLMSLCRHNIIANSSFSWWGAWLNTNPDKTVIAPDRWMSMNNVDSPVPADWQKI